MAESAGRVLPVWRPNRAAFANRLAATVVHATGPQTPSISTRQQVAKAIRKAVEFAKERRAAGEGLPSWSRSATDDGPANADERI